MRQALSSRPAPRAAPTLAPALERLVGTLLGLYLLAQCFSLPLVEVGPWALWPTLPDLLLWLAGGAALLYHAPLRSAGQRNVLFGLLLVAGLAACAFGVLFVMRDPRLPTAVAFGLFGLYKVVQLLLAYFAATRLALTPELLRFWRRCAGLAFALTVVSIVWTSFSDALPTFLGEFLPRGRPAAGPWEAYYLHNETGLGAIGYNHGYVALQVMLLGTVLGLLRPGRSNVGVLGLMLVATFFTGSRAGLAGAVVLVALEYRRTPLRATLVLLGLGLAALLAAPWLGVDAGLSSLAERQATLLAAGEGSDLSGNLSGRDDIWGRFTGGMVADPFRFLIGSGLGSAINNGGNAHMQPLQVLYEAGVAGLVTYALLFWIILRELWRSSLGRALLPLMAALWVTALTQETFYPNPAFGGFLPLLALSLALALRPPTPEEEARP